MFRLRQFSCGILSKTIAIHIPVNCNNGGGIMIKNFLSRLRFARLLSIIFIINLVWLSINKVENGNMWDTFFNVFNSVYIYTFVFLPGLLYFIETNIRKEKINFFINIRIRTKLQKTKNMLKTGFVLSILYTIGFFFVVFITLCIVKGISFSWSQITIATENSNTIFYKNIQPCFAAFLLVLRYLLLAINICLCFIFLEVVLGKRKILVLGIYILLCVCFDFSNIPILAMFYIGCDNTFLLAGKQMEIVICFCIRNICIVVMGIMYWFTAQYCCSKINLERI